MTLLLIFLFGALAISFMCSVLEAVLMSTPISYITMREDEGYKPATLFKKYKQVLKEQWDKEKEAFAGIDTFIDSLADYTRESNERNLKMWPVSYVEYPVGDEHMDFDEAIETMKKNIHSRIDEMDGLMDSLVAEYSTGK